MPICRVMPVPRREAGFTLVAVGLCLAVLVGCLGLALDLGRMYIVKSEAQVWADAASIAAALELDGTSAGLTRSANAAIASPGSWEFNTRQFPTPTVTFATSLAGPWSDVTAASTASGYVRVSVHVPVQMYTLPAVSGVRQGHVTVRATAAQVVKNSFSEGLFPFSPYAHSSVAPDFGLIPGQSYTLRWPANPKLTGASNVCPGDRVQSTVDLANAAGGSERGFIEDTSANLIASTIIADYQSITRTVGDIVSMTGGAKQSQLNSLDTRINQDTDNTSTTYAQYLARGLGNGRRIVACPINDGGTPPGSNNRIVSIGAFFLYPTGQYGHGGNQAWCAEYIGSYLEGADHTGVVSTGSWVVRIVQ